MDTYILRSGSQVTVGVKGDFTGADNIKFQKVIALTEDAAIKTIIMDFTAVTAIDSAGVDMLMTLYHSGKDKGIKLSVLGAKGKVAKTLKLLESNNNVRQQHAKPH